MYLCSSLIQTDMKHFDFTAIDFETMTAERTSACAIGIVRVENCVITQKFYSLIKPIPDSRTKDNSFVHGITPNMVENAPTFEELWPAIKHYFEKQVIVCHNADFDTDVLDKVSDFYGIDFPIEDIIDTMQITHAGLAQSCAMSNIPLPDHHDALCDATACAMIVLSCWGVDNFRNEKKKDKPSGIDHSGKAIEKETLRPLCDEEIENKETPFFHKKVVLTGTLSAFPKREVIAGILKQYGADINTSISRQTDIVIVGAGAGPSKMKKIHDLNASGCQIRVVEEPEFHEIIEKYGLR